MWVAAVMPQGSGDVVVAGEAENADDGVADRGHDLRSGTDADRRAVLVEDDVSDPVQAVLDGPVSTDPGGDLDRVDDGHRRRADHVDDLDALAVRSGDCATHLHHLCGVREAHSGCDFGGLDRAAFTASIATPGWRGRDGNLVPRQGFNRARSDGWLFFTVNT